MAEEKIYTKEELEAALARTDRKISLLNDRLGNLYSKAEGKLNAEELKEEIYLRKEIVKYEKRKSNINKRLKNIPSESKTPEEENKSYKGLAIGTSIISLVLVIALLSTAINSRKRNNESAQISQTVSISTMEPAPTPTITPEEEVLFSDVNNEEELIERAKLIFDIDLKPILEDYDNAQINGKVTEERLIDIIRVSLGELPINSEYDNNTVNETITDRMDIYGNLGSKPTLDKIYPVHYSLLAPDDSEISEYMSTYDTLYNNIAESRNNGDIEGAISNIEALGVKHYNEWILGGLYGEYDPYLFDSELHALALGASVERYVSYVLEFIDSNKLTVCVPVCIDYETGETKLVNVVDIYEAILLGKSQNSKVYMSYFGDEQITKISKVFNKELTDTLEYKNSLVLKRG